MSRFYGIDASVYIFQAYFARQARHLSEQGFPLNALEGYLETLLKFLHSERPAHVLVVFDESLGRGYRERLYPAYKSRRVLPDEALAYQLRACRRLSEALGLYCHAEAEFEADDILASAARQAREQRLAVTIVSRDKDLAQLLCADADRLWHFGSAPRSAEDWRRERGVACERVADFLAVAGDAVDDIPGLKGVGEKTAKVIFEHYPSLEAIYRDLDGLAALPVRGAKGLRDKFANAREKLFLFRQLCRLRDDLALPGFEQAALRKPAVDDWMGQGEALGLSANYLYTLQSRYPRAFVAPTGAKS